MKIKSFILIFSIVFAVNAQNIQISGEIKNSPDPEVFFNFPVNGKYFAANNEIVSIENQRFMIEKKLNKAGFVSVTNNFVTAMIYAEPGKKYVVNFDAEEYEFAGETAAKQEFINNLGLFENANQFEELEAQQTLSDKLKFHQNWLNENQEKLNEGLKNKWINQAEFTLFSNLLELKYQDFLATDFFFTYRYFYEEKNLAERFLKIYGKEYEDIFSKALENPYLTNYLSPIPFLDKYKALQDLKATGRLNFGAGNVPYGISQIAFFQEILAPNLQEWDWANKIYDGLSSHRFEREWIGNFEAFKKKYPNSALAEKLEALIQEVRDYHQPKKEITFVENYENINSLSDLFEQLRGKVIYVDLWATWCGSCRLELQYSKKNHAKLEEMGVLPLYLSVDSERQDEDWRAMTQSLGLTGLHMRANPQLKAELDERLKNGIPYYIIVGKDGKVKAWGAKRPSDQQDLFDQLTLFL